MSLLTLAASRRALTNSFGSSAFILDVAKGFEENMTLSANMVARIT